MVQDDAIEAARNAHKHALSSPCASLATAAPLPSQPPGLLPAEPPPPSLSAPVGPAGAAAAASAAHAASLAAHGPGLEKAAQDAVRVLWFGSSWKGFGNKTSGLSSGSKDSKSGADVSPDSPAGAAAAHLMFLAGQLMLEECTMAADLCSHDLYHQGKVHRFSFECSVSV